MPIVRFLREKLEVDVPEGTTILEAARLSGAPEGDRCGGVCACSTCHVYVVEGFDNTSEIEDEEFDILDKAFDVRMESRLGCQARIEGDIDVIISDESFQAYLDEHPAEAEAANERRSQIEAEDAARAARA
ncbi:MAG: 2Fe-2S iron-sulfur cluster-binding protein [Myxococcales bacterium]|nr:2Fe-2S iron-sulfur cluster-binding protein [Myxococcales bacterium]